MKQRLNGTKGYAKLLDVTPMTLWRWSRGFTATPHMAKLAAQLLYERGLMQELPEFLKDNTHVEKDKG